MLPNDNQCDLSASLANRSVCEVKATYMIDWQAGWAIVYIHDIYWVEASSLSDSAIGVLEV